MLDLFKFKQQKPVTFRRFLLKKLIELIGKTDACYFLTHPEVDLDNKLLEYSNS